MSFGDMMESSRGPGVIGMLMAMVVLAGFSLLYLFVFDEDLQGGGRPIESVIDQQAREIESLEKKIEQANVSFPQLMANMEELAVVKAGNQKRADLIVNLVDNIARSDADRNANAEAFENYKDEYRRAVRSRAQGSKMDVLQTTKGESYVNVTINEVTDVGLQIRHDTGLRRIPYEELPVEMRDHFQFDPDQKSATMAKELGFREAHESAVKDAHGGANTSVMKPSPDKDAVVRQENVTAEIATLESRARLINDELEALRRELYNQRYKSVRNSPQIRIKIAEREKQLIEIRNRLSRLNGGR